MKRSLILTLAATVALAAPLAAQAQNASATVTVNGEVTKACVIGQPASVSLALGDLTGPDGRISAEKASATPSQSTTIATAWCNAPSTMSIDGSPLSLTAPPAYASPAGFSRLISYKAEVIGWTGALFDEPLVGDSAKTLAAPSAYAATGDGLKLDISSLKTLNTAGSAAAAAIVEAGSYSGTVVISVATQ
ncbi:MAG: hypothetical protein EON95_08310 [Caulobacteraceae bacterium]|nr:MAG: hypothetical protein EON95_08310 [Caulobacteraceae bacterium]